MKRLADHIAAYGLTARDEVLKHVGRDYLVSLQQEVATSRIIVADNVAEFLYAESDQETWDYGTDFPTMAPPFPRFFIEWKKPSRLNSTDLGVRSADGFPEMMGALCYGASMAQIHADFPDTETTRTRLERATEAARSSNYGHYSLGILTLLINAMKSGVDLKASLPRDGWMLEAVVFVNLGERRTRIAPYTLRFTIDKSGKYQHHALGVLGDIDPQTFPPGAGSECFTAALCISFMHCKNVTAQLVEPPQPMSDAHRRRHGKPLSRYYTLEINPMREVLRREGGAGDGNSLQKALHICRGHFKDYRASGLFGRVKGVFWWDHHVRGNSEAGTVLKDYDVGRGETRGQN